MHLRRARLEQHQHDRPRRVAADDRVVDDHDPLARDLGDRVELHPDPLLAHLLVGLDERAPHVAVLDQALAERDPARAREADRGRRARVGDRQHEVGLDRRLARRAARPSARARRAPRRRRAASRGARGRRTRRCRARRRSRPAPPASRGSRRRRSRRARRARSRARTRRRRGRARRSPRRPPSPRGCGRGRAAGSRTGRGRRAASPPRARRPRRRPRASRIVFATASSSGASSEEISAAITSVSEVEPSLTPRAASSSRSFVGVREVAVVAERDRPRAAVVDERLRVRPVRRAGGRVARVPDRGLAAQAAQLLLVEDLRDEAEVAQRREPALVGDGDPRRLLAAVLEREEAEVGEPGDVAVVRVDAEDAAHRGPGLLQRGEREPEEPVAADDADPAQALRAEPLDVPGRAGDDRAAAALAEERERVVGQLELGADPGVERGLGEADREPAVGDVVRQRQERGGLPEEADRAPPRPRGRAGRARRRARRRAPGTRSRRTRARARRRGGRRRPPATRPGRRARPATRPTQPTTGVGWIERPSLSL